FVTQLLSFLLELEVANRDDVRHATWSLSGQPRDGVDGVFEFTSDDLQELSAGLYRLLAEPDDERLLAAALVALAGWRELEATPAEALATALAPIPTERHPELVGIMLEVVGGATALEGLRQLGDGISQHLAERYANLAGIDALLERGVAWPLDAA